MQTLRHRLAQLNSLIAQHRDLLEQLKLDRALVLARLEHQFKTNPDAPTLAQAAHVMDRIMTFNPGPGIHLVSPEENAAMEDIHGPDDLYCDSNGQA